MPRASDYPVPSYAAYAWYARGRFFCARPGKSAVSFEDTPDGLNELREFLRGASEARTPLGGARSGEAASALAASLREPPAPRVRKVTARGRPKLDAGDLWGDNAEEL